MEEAITRRYNLLAQKNGKTELELGRDAPIWSRNTLRSWDNAINTPKKWRRSRPAVMPQIMTIPAKPPIAKAGLVEKDAVRRNDVSHLTPEIFEEWAQAHLFEYQLYVREHKQEDWRFYPQRPARSV
ncbi:Uncharacterised protein [Klebsiella michiganensis]|uniref:Uncharacterized protein n=1 Tax=Klebsiella michiganensis TaxID=1134687 RepID=A0A7H4LS20_9ENTR|nr:Uncharacterised protein [Klebsiella michiganensis]